MKKNIKKAAAIHYDPNNTAPKVIAKGKGIVADKILDKAIEENIPIYEEPKLADNLTKLDIGQEIPKELYEVIAEILVFVNDIDKLEAKVNARKKQL